LDFFGCRITQTLHEAFMLLLFNVNAQLWSE